MSGKKRIYDIYNRGADFEIEALFIAQWCELKRVLYKHMWIKPAKAKMVDE